MSSFTDQMYANAATSTRGMITGTFEDPIRRSWGEVHDEARRMAGALSDIDVVPGTSVAVLAGDPADVAPLAQAVWMRSASLTMLAQPTPRTDLATWLADTHRAARTIRAGLTIVGAPFTDAAEPLNAAGQHVVLLDEVRNGPTSNRCTPTSRRSRCTS
jgi:fatty-acyl-CoA synthase